MDRLPHRKCDLCRGFFLPERVPLMVCIHEGDLGKIYCLPCLGRKDTPPCPCLEYDRAQCGHTKLWVPPRDLETCSFCGLDVIPSHLGASHTRWSKVMCAKGLCHAPGGYCPKPAGCEFKAALQCFRCYRTFCPEHLVKRKGDDWCHNCNHEAGEVTH
jgi:hypothetical protein